MKLATLLPSPSRVGGFLWAARTAMRAGGLPNIALTFHGGLGDDILCGIVIRELKKRGASNIWLMTRFAALYAGDPDFKAVPQDHRLWRFCGMAGKPRLELEYPHPPPHHIIATMCAGAGIHGEIDLLPKLYLTSAERSAGKVVQRRQVAIQTSSLAARYPMLNKQWPTGRFSEVADALRTDFDLVQLGASSDPALAGALDLRGKTTERQTAAILSASHVFVGLESGLMHMARAVDCRSVIVYGGRLLPSQTGYSANENLAWNGPCSPCWQRNDCDHDRVCLQEILPASVIAAARRQAELFGMPLPVDRVTLNAA